jgi:adenosine deaminase
MTLKSYIDAMPKVELHVHLEGSTQPETLLELADRNGVKLPVTTPEALRALYDFRDFEYFLDIYMMIISALRRPQDFSDLVYRFGAEMARQNIRYAEVTWTPQFYVKGEIQLPFPELLAAINDGRDRASAEWGVQMRWIPDIARNAPQYMLNVQEWVCSDAARDGGVVALGLGGFEVGFPPEMFEEPFRRARECGVPGNPHAGETQGPASVWGALNVLGATRIGHGVRSIEDAELVAHLAVRKMPLEVNPTSNLRLKIYKDYTEHPLKKLLDAGCIVSINSDDPPLFNTTLTDEYHHAIDDCGLSIDELEQCVLNAICVSYLSDAEKSAMLTEFEAEFTHLHPAD